MSLEEQQKFPSRENYKEFTAYCRKQNLCTSCTKSPPIIGPRGGSSTCGSCSTNRAIKKKKYLSSERSKYAYRQRIGACRCGKPAENGKSYCSSCQNKNRNSAAGFRAEYKKKGLCISCGRERDRAPLLTCNKCKKRARDYAKELKITVMTAYGHKCFCCGESKHQFLTIDHVFRDGHKDRLDNNFTAATKFYTYLKNLGFPKDRYRILCFNCNNASFRYGGVCPHIIRYSCTIEEPV